MATPQFSLADHAQADSDDRITFFGITDTRGQRVPFGIKREDRSRHTYVIGKTGMGKSTLLENMAIQDIQNGEGLCFIDPHGGTAEKLLRYIPEDRVKDVLYFAPFDMEYPISFNVLEDVGPDKRHFVVAGLMSTFEKIWVDAWSARMAYILQNTLGALLEFPGATLLGVNRMYIDKEYRKNVIAHITDPSVRSFWVDEYSKYTDRYTQEATPAIQNKIGQFAANALVRNIVGQEHSAFDMRELMDKRKIFIVNLSKGRVGEGNANLLGSMLITKIYLAAMSRADATPAELRELPPFYLYVDEFQNFANKSFADILSEARKYKLALTITHQYIEQMEDEVRAAVFGNVGTMMTFRVGSYDAEVLEKEFAPIFTTDDLVNLGARQIYLKLMIDGVSSTPFSARTMAPIEEPDMVYADRAIAHSRAQFSRPRAEVETDITNWVQKEYEDPDAEEKERARAERRAAREAANSGPGPMKARNGNSRPPAGQAGGDRKPRPPRANSRNDDRPSRKPRAPRPPAVAPPSEPGAEELKDVLARMSKPDIEKKPEGQKKASSEPTQEQQVAQQPVQQKQLAPVRDDGKSVTEEGKNELRNLLATLGTNTAQEKPAIKRPAPQKAAPPQRQPAESNKTASVSAASNTQQKTPVAPTPEPQVTAPVQEEQVAVPQAPDSQASPEPVVLPRRGEAQVAPTPEKEHETHVPIQEVDATVTAPPAARGAVATEPAPTQPVELTEDEMRAMLTVDKPHLK